MPDVPERALRARRSRRRTKAAPTFAGIRCPNSVDARLIEPRLGFGHEDIQLSSGSFTDRDSRTRRAARRRLARRITPSSSVTSPNGLSLPALPALGATGRAGRVIPLRVDSAGPSLCGERSDFRPCRNLARATRRRMHYPADFRAGPRDSRLRSAAKHDRR